MMPEEDHFNDYDNQGDKKHENRNAVDAMHVFHPLRMWLIGVSFFDIEIL